MAQDLLTTYKYGWKTSYYQNTHDMKTDEIDEPSENQNENIESLVKDLLQAQEESCDSCTI